MNPSGLPPPYSPANPQQSPPPAPPPYSNSHYHHHHHNNHNQSLPPQQQQHAHPFYQPPGPPPPIQYHSLPNHDQHYPQNFGKNNDRPFMPNNCFQNAPPGIDPIVWDWFKAVDEDGNGKITAQELQTSLMNNNCTPFNSETCRLMVGMFDVDRNGTIDIYEFSSLWKYIQEWRACFDSFDTDRSGTIDVHELSNAFKTFGYNLSQNFCQLCIRVFDRKGRSSIKFDDFIQCCVMLKVLSAKFMQRDAQKTGVIRVYYEEFMKMALDNTIV